MTNASERMAKRRKEVLARSRKNFKRLAEEVLTEEDRERYRSTVAPPAPRPPSGHGPIHSNQKKR